MHVETCATLWYLSKTKKNIFFLILSLFKAFFPQLPSTQTIKVIGLIFFLWAGHEKLGYEHVFQPYAYSLRPFSRGGPQAIQRIRPPSLYIGLNEIFDKRWENRGMGSLVQYSQFMEILQIGLAC